MSTATRTATATYTTTDIQAVMRRVRADLVMIASSTGAVTEDQARNWAHDIELLAERGFLNYVDLTLLSHGVEQQATRFTVNTQTGALTGDRPGDALWPTVSGPRLRIVLFYTSRYTQAERDALAGKMRIQWRPTTEDTSHATLQAKAGRTYASNGYGMRREDYRL